MLKLLANCLCIAPREAGFTAAYLALRGLRKRVCDGLLGTSVVNLRRANAEFRLRVQPITVRAAREPLPVTSRTIHFCHVQAFFTPHTNRRSPRTMAKEDATAKKRP